MSFKVLLLISIIIPFTTQSLMASSYETEAYQNYKPENVMVAETIDAELATIFRNDDFSSLQALLLPTETTIGLTLYLFGLGQGSILKTVKESQNAELINKSAKLKTGVIVRKILGGALILDSTLRFYILVGMNKDPGFFPLVSIAKQQFQKLTDAEQAAYIEELRNQFIGCARKAQESPEQWHMLVKKKCYEEINTKLNLDLESIRN